MMNRQNVRNPLRRTSDRVERWSVRSLLAVMIFAVPAVSLRAGLAMYDSDMRTLHSQVAERHLVTAQLLSDATGVPTEAVDVRQGARVGWTEKDGRQGTGIARVEPGLTRGATVRLWVDRHGRVTDPPLSTGLVTATAWFVGLMAGAAVIAVCGGTWAVVRLILNRGRYRRWETDWKQVEARWSSRFIE
ncbi:hypothetical protein [Streptomyces anthocyanicus]|uniref:Rv1733c family protein n=1 Tax=Streptomyces anthocyanicus TaxID=68174 RepID=UPI002E33358D|nr:hypothetical protein [Streptomyces anthocyanicus]